MSDIMLKRLRQIIAEEINNLNESSVDHAGIRDVVNASSKLLAAVETFKKSANITMTNSLTPHLSQIEKMLDNMVNNPGSYVDKKKSEPKVVKLRPIKDDE